MPKKSNATRADGRISVQVYIGRVDGKKKYKTVYGRTQKEASAKAEEVRLKLGKGIDLSTQTDTFKSWADRWLAMKKSTVSISQYDTVKARVEYLKNGFGAMPLTEVRPHHIQEVLDRLFTENPKTHRPTAKGTLNSVKQIAAQIFDYAIRNRVTDYNPALYSEIAKNAKVIERRMITDEEQRRVREFYHRAQPAAMIMLYSGLRRGELSALTWSDIDLKDKSISVTKSYDYKTRKIKDPKTKNSVRKVYIPDVLIDYLSDLPRKSILVFPSANGQVMSDNAWRTLWESYMIDLDVEYGSHPENYSKHSPEEHILTIEPFTPHCLRHTFCSLMYKAGVPVLVTMKQMGHSDVKTTLAIYTHLDSEQQKSDISPLNAYLCQSSVSQQLNNVVDK